MRNEDFDPIMALYDDAAALREIAGRYREEKVGLASLLSMVADDVPIAPPCWMIRKGSGKTAAS